MRGAEQAKVEATKREVVLCQQLIEANLAAHKSAKLGKEADDDEHRRERKADAERFAAMNSLLNVAVGRRAHVEAALAKSKQAREHRPTQRRRRRRLSSRLLSVHAVRRTTRSAWQAMRMQPSWHRQGLRQARCELIKRRLCGSAMPPRLLSS